MSRPLSELASVKELEDVKDQLCAWRRKTQKNIFWDAIVEIDKALRCEDAEPKAKGKR